MNSYQEHSDEFFTKHPDLFDRVLLKVNATVKLSFEAHSDLTEEELVKMVRERIANGGEIVCGMDFQNPNDEDWVDESNFFNLDGSEQRKFLLSKTPAERQKFFDLISVDGEDE
jgi:hypothetical protein